MNFLGKNVANLLTLGNLFSGCVGAIHLMSGEYRITAICIVISLILDFFDGFLARALRSNGPLGIQLDSLADMISFGLIPGLAMFKAFEFTGNYSMSACIFLPKYLGLSITIFSCLRLAIFNIDTEQKHYFKGLNTPCNTLMVFGLYYAFMEKNFLPLLFLNEFFLIFFTFLSSYLLICPMKMISLKFKNFKIKENYSKIILLSGSLLLLFIFGIVAIPLIVVYYILVSSFFQKEMTG